MLFVFVCCVISNQSTSKKPQYVSDLVTNNTRPDLSGIMVPRLQLCRSVISLSRVTYQIWRDPPFSQVNKATKIAVGVEVGGVRRNLEKEV